MKNSPYVRRPNNTSRMNSTPSPVAQPPANPYKTLRPNNILLPSTRQPPPTRYKPSKPPIQPNDGPYKTLGSKNIKSPYGTLGSNHMLQANRQHTTRKNIKFNNTILKGVGFHGYVYYNTRNGRTSRIVKVSLKKPKQFNKLPPYNANSNILIQQSNIQTLGNAQKHLGNKITANIMARFQNALPDTPLSNNTPLYGINMKDLGISINKLTQYLLDGRLTITKQFLITLLL